MITKREPLVHLIGYIHLSQIIFLFEHFLKEPLEVLYLAIFNFKILINFFL